MIQQHYNNTFCPGVIYHLGTFFTSRGLVAFWQQQKNSITWTDFINKILCLILYSNACKCQFPGSMVIYNYLSYYSSCMFFFFYCPPDSDLTAFKAGTTTNHNHQQAIHQQQLGNQQIYPFLPLSATTSSFLLYNCLFPPYNLSFCSVH